MNDNEELDAYLLGLLQTANGAGASPAPTVPVGVTDAVADLIAEMDADPAFAATRAPAEPADAVADLIAEMDADPAFAATRAPAEPADAVADLIAEMDADPAFAAATRVPAEPADAVADLIAEMDADPAFAAATRAPAEPADAVADLIAEMDADPAFAATRAPAKPADAVADLIAEMDADPAFAAATRAPVEPTDAVADLIAEMDADPAFADADTVDQPALATPPRADAPSRGPSLPPQIQALLPAASGNHATSTAQPAGNDHGSRWLRLRCGNQSYALELLKVQEVVLPTPLLRLRGTARSMLGIMNLRGQVVPVLDLGLHLGTEAVQDSPSTRVVVLEENGETIGLRVSAVDDVTTIASAQIEPPDNTRLCKTSNQFFRGVARLSQSPMILLDAARFLQ